MSKALAVAIMATLALSACTPPPGSDAGCLTYDAQVPSMPRPLPNDALGHWTAVTYAAMTGACR